MSPPLQILHLEDEPTDAELTARRLRRHSLDAAGAAPEITVVATRADFEAALRAGAWDLILADYRLPGFDGLEALELARAHAPDIPFIFLTGELGEERAIETVQRGATDYILKNRLDRLAPAVSRAVREARERRERQEAQAVAAAEREWLRVTLSSIGDAVIATDTSAHITFLNSVAEALTGWPQAEAVGRPVDDVFAIFSEDAGAALESPIHRVLRENLIIGLNNHTLLRTRSGESVPIDDSAAPIRDADGRLLGVVLVFRDIRERRAAEAARDLSEERYRSLVTAHSAIVWTANAAGEFDQPQPQWQVYTGQSLEQYRGLGWLEAIHPDDRAQVRADWEQARQTGQPFESAGRIWNATGDEWCWFEARGVPLRAPDGAVREWIGTVTDVNERKQAEAAARESEGRFRILADSAPVMIWLSGPDGRPEYFNRAWLDFTGRPLEQEVGAGWTTGLHPAERDAVVAADQAGSQSRQAYELEYRLRRHDGVYRWVVDRAVPRFNPEGGFLGFIGSAMDIDERKTGETLQAARARQQAIVAALGQQALAGAALPDLFESAVREVAPALTADLVKLLELLPGGQAMRLAAGVGWRPGLVGAATVSAGQNSQAGYTLLADEPVIVTHLPTETRFSGPPLLIEHGVVSGLSVIIRGAAEPWGVLGVHTTEPRAFTTDDVNFVQSVANVLGEAIARQASETELRAARDQIAAILEGVAEGVTVQDATGKLVYANDTAARMLGYSSGAALAAAPLEEIMGRFLIYDDQGQPFPLAQLPGRRALLGEPEPAALVRFRVWGTQDEHWSDVRARPIFNAAGRPVLAVNIFHDVTAIMRSEQTQRLLARAGELLAGELDEVALLRNLVQTTLGDLADYAVAYQVEGRQVRVAAFGHLDPSREAILQQALSVQAPRLSAPTDAVAKAMTSGEPFLVPDVTPDILALLPDEMRHLVHQLDPRSTLTAPLVARGRTLGALSLVRSSRTPPFGPPDLALAQELARRAALALDNVRLLNEANQLNAALDERVRARTEALNLALEQVQTANTTLQAEITERQQAEARFRGLLQSAPDAIVITDAAGAIVLVNAEAEAMFGYPAVALAGQPIESLIPDRYAETHRQYREHFLAETPANQLAPTLSLFGRHHQGHEFPVEISLSPLRAPEGLLITSIIRDVSERLQMEAEIRASREQLRRLSSHLQAVREAERTRISREIHDELGGALTGLKMYVARLAQNSPELTPAIIQSRAREMADLIDSTVKMVRRIATDLRPGILDDFGLPAAIEWQLNEFANRSGLECAMEGGELELILDQEAATALFRIFQETLTNIGRHAQATAVRVHLAVTGPDLVLEVSDNGRGITPEEVAARGSLGLLGMQERVHLLSGEIVLTGQPGQGTTVTIRIPLVQLNKE